MKALLINASKERHGRTQALGEQLLKGLEMKTIHLADYTIAPIGQACEHDEYAQVIDQLVGQDIIVFGTPVYWSDMTGYLKTFIDRLQELMDTDLASPSNPFYRAHSYLVIQGTAPADAIPGVNRVIEHVSERFFMEYQESITSMEEAKRGNSALRGRRTP